METLTSYEFPKHLKGIGSRYAAVENGVIYRLTQGDELFPSDVEVDRILGRLKSQGYNRKCITNWDKESDTSIVFQFVPKADLNGQ